MALGNTSGAQTTGTLAGTSGPLGAGGQAGGGTGATGGAGAGIGPGSTGGGSTGGGTGGAQTALPRGVTASTITIGVMYDREMNQEAAAFGADTSTGGFPDPKPQVDGIVKYLNEHGGIDGKKIVQVVYDRGTCPSCSDASSDQAACAKFTQDNHVYAVISVYQAHGQAPCLAKAGVPLIEAGNGPPRRGTQPYDSLGAFYVTPNQIDFTRYCTTVVDGLNNLGFFKGQKVGIAYYDSAVEHVGVQKGCLPEMKRLGVNLKGTVAMPYQQTPADYSEDVSAANTGVLQFQQQGITRVVLLDDQNTTFASSAENQHYYPKYGMSSIGSPAAFAAAQPKSAPGMVGVGYDPVADLGTADNVRIGPGEDLCKQIMVKYTNQRPSNALDWGIMQWHCDGFFFLRELLKRNLTFAIANWARAIAAVGTSFQSASVLGTDFGTGRFDGVSEFRPLAYNTDCKCIHYTGPAFTAAR